MTDNKFTDNDIAKALKCCANKKQCSDCPFCVTSREPCYITLAREAASLLSRREAEIEELEAEIDKQYEQAKADILGNMADGGTSCHWCIDQHRTEAIKEFAERLESKLANNTDISAVGYQSIIAEVDAVIKEMTEDTP